MSEKRRGIGDYISVLTITVLFIVILSLVVFAARGYQFAQETQDSNSNTRALLSYVINAVRDNDAGEIFVENRAGVECLVLESEGFEQLIYLSGGTVYEEYKEPGSMPDPKAGLEIGKADKFDFELGSDGVLGVVTEAGSSYVNTRRHK